MTPPPDSQSTDADPTETGADAVPDKTADTPAKGAEFDDEAGGTDDDTSEVPGAGADTSIPDQRD
jgi:hypothetical protein